MKPEAAILRHIDYLNTLSLAQAEKAVIYLMENLDCTAEQLRSAAEA